MTESSHKFTLRKPERLGEKKTLDEIYLHGESIHIPGIRLLWKQETNHQITKSSNHQIKVAFTVPKKIFKKAVQRNLLKRRMREAYRKNKLSLAEKPGMVFYLVFIYTGQAINTYTEIESKIVVTLQKLNAIISSQ